MGGKLAAEVVTDRAANMPYAVPLKEIRPEIYEKAAKAIAKEPAGVKGEGAIAFGGGAVLSTQAREQLRLVDPDQLISTN